MEERKLFEDGNVVITTERIVIGASVWPMSQISHVVARIDDNWIGTLIIAGIGVICLFVGGVTASLIGLFFICAAGLFWKYVRDDALIISRGRGDFDTVHINRNRETLKKIDRIVNDFLSMKAGFAYNDLHDELRKLKSIGEE